MVTDAETAPAWLAVALWGRGVLSKVMDTLWLGANPLAVTVTLAPREAEAGVTVAGEDVGVAVAGRVVLVVPPGWVVVVAPAIVVAVPGMVVGVPGGVGTPPGRVVGVVKPVVGGVGVGWGGGCT